MQALTSHKDSRTKKDMHKVYKELTKRSSLARLNLEEMLGLEKLDADAMEVDGEEDVKKTKKSK